MGGLGVQVFFILSGFLITRSRVHSPTTGRFVWKRILRIYPAYAASIIVVALAIAPFFSEKSISAYCLDRSLWHGIFHGLIFSYKYYYVIGVEFYSDPSNLGSVLNGVLWTLQTEVLLYIGVAILFALEALRAWVVLSIAIIAVFARLADAYIYINIADTIFLNFWGLSYGAPGFFAGAFLYLLFRKHEPSTDIALVLASLAIGLLLVDTSVLLPFSADGTKLFPALADYSVIWLGFHPTPIPGQAMRFGDLSYGIYVFGWPVQQTTRAILGDGLSGEMFFLACMPAIVLAAMASWRWIEEPPLRLKDLSHRRTYDHPQEIPAAGEQPNAGS
ncbi:acyltransferase family protein [Tropicimonas aquimaris]|uniref:Acyltransferase family protein n=1 Tax=Tropicimonas aquimaris TaxID=914152 RepID=A0ABW3IRS1_9RHOB